MQAKILQKIRKTFRQSFFYSSFNNFQKLLADNLHLNGLAFAFAALREPRAEAFGKTFGGEAEAGFDFSVGDGKRVVEVGGVGEIAHAKLIEPIERAGAGGAVDDYVYVEFLCVHGARGPG